MWLQPVSCGRSTLRHGTIRYRVALQRNVRYHPVMDTGRILWNCNPYQPRHRPWRRPRLSPDKPDTGRACYVVYSLAVCAMRKDAPHVRPTLWAPTTHSAKHGYVSRGYWLPGDKKRALDPKHTAKMLWGNCNRGRIARRKSITGCCASTRAVNSIAHSVC